MPESTSSSNQGCINRLTVTIGSITALIVAITGLVTVLKPWVPVSTTAPTQIGQPGPGSNIVPTQPQPPPPQFHFMDLNGVILSVVNVGQWPDEPAYRQIWKNIDEFQNATHAQVQRQDMPADGVMPAIQNRMAAGDAPDIAIGVNLIGPLGGDLCGQAVTDRFEVVCFKAGRNRTAAEHLIDYLHWVK